MSKDELVLRIESLERQVQQLLFAMQSYVGEELDSGMRADEPDERHRGEPVRGDFRPRVSDGRPPILQEPEPEAVPPAPQRTWQPAEPAERKPPELEPEPPTPPRDVSATWQPASQRPAVPPPIEPEPPPPPRDVSATWQPEPQKPASAPEPPEPPPPEVPELPKPQFTPDQTERPPETPSEEPYVPIVIPQEMPSEWQPEPRIDAPEEFGQEPPPPTPPQEPPQWQPDGKPKPEDIRGWETQPDIVDIEDIFGEKAMEEAEEKDTKRDKGYEETLLDQARDTAERYQDMLYELGTLLQQIADSMMGLRAQVQNISAQIEISEKMMA